jgi:hypothetical protein
MVGNNRHAPNLSRRAMTRSQSIAALRIPSLDTLSVTATSELDPPSSRSESSLMTSSNGI